MYILWDNNATFLGVLVLLVACNNLIISMHYDHNNLYTV